MWRGVDAAQARRVADAFLDAPRTSSDATVRAAYADLSEQASRWFVAITGCQAPRPVRVVYTDCREPYTSVADLSHAVRRHHTLELCPCARDHDRRHPLLDTSALGAYDRLRAVHDIVSHGWRGYAFDRNGEFAAWLLEDRMYTGLARWALATELHGEHSVLWTSGGLADHKAMLLDPQVLKASRAHSPTNRVRNVGPGGSNGSGPAPTSRTLDACRADAPCPPSKPHLVGDSVHVKLFSPGRSVGGQQRGRLRPGRSAQ
jgi:hypothetical protein